MLNTLRDKHFELITLGGLALRTPAVDTTGLAKRRRKIAVLAVLALSRRPPSRDTLVDMFWGDESEERARHSLSDCLSHLRRVLGRDAIATRSDRIELDMSGRLAVDALAFEAASECRDFDRAIELYAGPFLAGFHVERSESFDRWVSRMRDGYERRFSLACHEHFTQLMADGRVRDAAGVAQRWRAMVDSPAAIAAIERSDEALAAVTMSAAAVDATVFDVASRDESVGAEAPPVSVPVRHSFRRLSFAAAASFAAIAASVALRWLPSGRTAHAAEGPLSPAVALTDVRTDVGDSSLSWLREGFRQMIAADLSHAAPSRIVAMPVVYDAEVRAGWTDSLTPDQAVDVARRVHASLAASAVIARDDGAYVVDVTLRPIGDPAHAQHFTATGTDILALADQVAASILSVSDAAASGPRLSEVETSSATAFRHFVEGMRLRSEGRWDKGDSAIDAAIAEDSNFTSAIVARLHSGDSATYARIKPLFDRARLRLTEWDRMSESAYEALHSGDHARAEVLGRELVTRFPRDPRGLDWLGWAYLGHGRFAAAETTFLRLLALDSLAILAGDGPCAPCSAYTGLVLARHSVGDTIGERRAAEQWTHVQPGFAGSWLTLAQVEESAGAYDRALAYEQRARQLTDDRSVGVRIGRTLIMARRYGEADSVARSLLVGDRQSAVDLLATLLRERGDNAGALRLLDNEPSVHSDVGLGLLRAHMLGEMGADTKSRAIFEALTPHPTHPSLSERFGGAFAGDDARAFAWHHALEADAVWRRADLAFLGALADSVERIGAKSYYARDWKLHHHIRGLIAERMGRYTAAEREFTAALEIRGWTRTNLELARVQLLEGKPARAIESLRMAYREPLDAMGRYVAKSALDAQMAEAFRAAGLVDSARVYEAFAERSPVRRDIGGALQK